VTLVADQAFNSLGLAAIYFLVAAGITLVFGLTRIVNFAQGQLVLLGAFMSYACSRLHLPIVVCLLASFLAVGAAGEALDLGVFRRTLSRPLNGFIISLGLISACEAAFALIWPADDYFVPQFTASVWHVGGVVISAETLIIIVVAALCLTLASVLIGRTQYGRGIRALAEDRPGAQALGVQVGRLTSLVFGIGCGLAGLAGGLFGGLIPFNSVSGTNILSWASRSRLLAA
jgi:branched-chain amino acid transport system permease protein